MLMTIIIDSTGYRVAVVERLATGNPARLFLLESIAANELRVEDERRRGPPERALDECPGRLQQPLFRGRVGLC